MVNVWDAISARSVAAVEGTRALATASHSIAASLGHADGENIPVEEMLAAVDFVLNARTDAFGPRRLTTIGVPGTPTLAWQETHGVARVSHGPLSQNVALTALQEIVEDIHRGGGVPATSAS